MRKIGSLTTAPHAARFQRYLAAVGINSRVDQVPDAWEVWVVDEDQVEAGRRALGEFEAAPEATQFDAPEVPSTDRKRPAPVRRVRRLESAAVPLTVMLIIVSSAVSLGTQFGFRPSSLLESMVLTNVHSGSHWLPVEVSHGQWWRLVTPMFLHSTLLHLAFNMYWTWILAGNIERQQGSAYLLAIVLLVAVVSDLTQFYVDNVAFGGMSGVMYGLFGFLWMRSTFLPGDGFFMPPSVVTIMLLWLLLCLTPAIPNIANGAHFGGLASGAALGALPRLWRD